MNASLVVGTYLLQSNLFELSKLRDGRDSKPTSGLVKLSYIYFYNWLQINDKSALPVDDPVGVQS